MPSSKLILTQVGQNKILQSPVQQFKISSLASLETRTFGIISLIILLTAAIKNKEFINWRYAVSIDGTV